MAKAKKNYGNKSNKYVDEKMDFNEGLLPEQIEAKKVIEENILTTLRGRAGSSKTHVAVNYALDKLFGSFGDFERIYITRAMINKKEHDMGFLAGDMKEKFDPWIIPMKEIIAKFVGVGDMEKLMREEIINIAPMTFIKGRTFTNSIVLVDEASDLTHRDIEALFTRIGKGSKMIFMGDINQCDLANMKDSGFPLLCTMADKSDMCGDFELTSNFRSPIVEELLEKYVIS